MNTSMYESIDCARCVPLQRVVVIQYDLVRDLNLYYRLNRNGDGG